MEEDAVVDFTLSSERARYAEEVLPGLTNLQTYTVQVCNYLASKNTILLNLNFHELKFTRSILLIYI